MAAISSAVVGPRLGTRMRSQLAAAMDARGHQRSTIWLLYSPKAAVDIVLRTELAFAHFLHAESDPEVQRIDYEPAARVARLYGEAVAALVDAEVTLRSGEVIWREIKPEEDLARDAEMRGMLQTFVRVHEAQGAAPKHEVWTEKRIYAEPQRIQNWLRVVPWLAQARAWPLQEYGNVVASLLNARRCVQFADVLELGEGPEKALYAAALLKAVQFGRFESDLNRMPFTNNSHFYLPGESP